MRNTIQSELQRKANHEKKNLRPYEYQTLLYLKCLKVPVQLKAIRFRGRVREVIDIYLPNRDMALMIDRQWSPERREAFQREYLSTSLKFVRSKYLNDIDGAYKYLKRTINTPNALGDDGWEVHKWT